DVAAHVPFDEADDVVGLQHRGVLRGGADDDVLAALEVDDGRGGVGALQVAQDRRPPDIVDGGNAGVRGSEVDPVDSHVPHLSVPSPLFVVRPLFAVPPRVGRRTRSAPPAVRPDPFAPPDPFAASSSGPPCTPSPPASRSSTSRALTSRSFTSRGSSSRGSPSPSPEGPRFAAASSLPTLTSALRSTFPLCANPSDWTAVTVPSRSGSSTG